MLLVKQITSHYLRFGPIVPDSTEPTMAYRSIFNPDSGELVGHARYCWLAGYLGIKTWVFMNIQAVHDSRFEIWLRTGTSHIELCECYQGHLTELNTWY